MNASPVLWGRRVLASSVAVIFALFAVGRPVGASQLQDDAGQPAETTTSTTMQPPPPSPPPDPAAKWLNHLHVDLAHQRVNAIANDGSLLRSMPASTGAHGRTPPGTYAVYSKSPWTTATGSPNVSMQWMTRFRGGIGFHAIPRKNGRPMATPLGIAPVSHGCVRLADEDAYWLYHTAPIGTRVVVK